ncbi:hypothetical protein PybrP1_002803 [[Pythium] brassicae (nom. inval.)]|nr:hypothetical protein PybrP1_002803 [[Pythium] brassicae (nom. inval.)]
MEPQPKQQPEGERSPMAPADAPEDALPPNAASILPRLRKKPFRFSSYAREDHGKAIYCVTFCDILPAYERVFAAVGGNRITVYECLESGGLDVVQVYCDGDAEEQYFTAAWTVDVLTGAPLLAAAGFRGHIKVLSLDVHLKGSCFVSSGMDNTIKVWDLEDAVVQDAISRKVHADYVDCVRMVGDLVLSKSTGHKVYQFKDAELWFMKFGLDSQLEVLAVGNKKGVVSVFDLDSEAERSVGKLTHSGCKSTIRQVCFSRSGRTLISCSDDATVWRWDLP